MKIEINKLTKAVENKRQQMMEDKVMEKRLLNELQTKFSIETEKKAKEFVKSASIKSEKIKTERNKLYNEFVEQYGNQLGIGEQL